MFSSLRSLLISLAVLCVVRGEFEGDPCVRKYDNSRGVCRNVRSCPKAREEHKHGVPLTICAYLSGVPVICCPLDGGDPPVQSPNSAPNLGSGNRIDQNRISVQKCEEYGELTKEKVFVNPLSLGSSKPHAISLSKCDATTPLIVGGEKTKNGEFPHMAAIGWQSLDGTLEFKCGGSLISEKFVLTAAHCGRSDGKAPTIVRLGDQNLRTRTDGMREVDVAIAQFIAHEQYKRSSYYYDIALIKLTTDVSFTKFIRPACLWQTQSINNTKTIATGWGYTETAGQTSDELMKVELDIIDNDHCDNFFEEGRLDRGIIGSQMCAGVLKGLKDTCNGDSGGPIQVSTPSNICLYHVIGITSFGSPFCGQKNSPGVYTRVSSYLDWIEAKVWSN